MRPNTYVRIHLDAALKRLWKSRAALEGMTLEAWVVSRVSPLPVEDLPTSYQTPATASSELEYAVKRVGSEHFEEVSSLGGNPRCAICGPVDEADPNDPVVWAWHGDSFLDADPPIQPTIGAARHAECPTLSPKEIDASHNGVPVPAMLVNPVRFATPHERDVLLGVECPSGHASTTETCPACALTRSRLLSDLVWRWCRAEEGARGGLGGVDRG